MTAAVCIHCGVMKVGAWTTCPECGYDPSGKGRDAEVKSLLLTDHYMTPQELGDASDAVRNGRPPQFNQVLFDQMMRETAGQETLVPKTPLGCVLASALLVILAAALIVLWLFA